MTDEKNKIDIEDIPEDCELKREDMEDVQGGMIQRNPVEMASAGPAEEDMDRFKKGADGLVVDSNV